MTQSPSSSSLRYPGPPSSFFLLFMSRVLLFGRAPAEKRSHGGPCFCLSVWLQIISDLMFFRGTHKKEFESRWKSFTLVKKSMENRVGSKNKKWEEKKKKAQQGRRLLSVSVSQSQGDFSSVSSLLLQLHGKKQHIRALLVDRVLLQHEVSLTPKSKNTHVSPFTCRALYPSGLPPCDFLEISSRGDVCLPSNIIEPDKSYVGATQEKFVSFQTSWPLTRDNPQTLLWAVSRRS